MAAKVARRGRIARRLGLLVVAAVLATSVIFPALAPAQTSATVPVTGGSWYWQEQIGAVNGPTGPVAPPSALPTPDVPAGDFPVSVVGGQPDKESFLQLDSSAIPAGSTVSSLVLTLYEDSAGGNLNAAMATVEARAVTGFLASGDAGKPWANRPSYDTTGPGAPGKRNANGSWSFDLTQIASGWASGQQSNNGIALVPTAPQQGQSYEVVWFGPTGSKAPTTEGKIDPPAPGTPQGEAAGVESTPTGEAAAPLSITPDTSGADLTSGASPSVASPPAAVGTSTAAPSTRTPGRVRTISTRRAPPWGFYLAVVAVIALIGASTLSLGELGEPEPERQGGVLRTLERQRERNEQV